MSYTSTLKPPNSSPSERWAKWRATLDLIIRHRDYRWDAASQRNRWVLLNLARCGQENLSIHNTAAWNKRNPNPHLP